MSAPTPNSPSETEITTADIAAAERLAGVSFTDAERALMLDESHARLAQYERLRALPLTNSVTPAFGFDPRPARDRPRAQPIRRDFPTQPWPEVERPSNLEDAAFWSVRQLGALLRTRQVTSVELTEMYLSRLERFNVQLECVITLTRELALRQAAQADAELGRGFDRGPLHGIPWGAKDLVSARGYPTTWGAAPYRDQIIDRDATVVERLAQAGAVLVAKLSMGELAHGHHWFGGSTRNPWNISTPSGGSSAGPAAATAAGLVGFSIGSETTGSIVWPAAYCGVTGLRPTFGLVPRTGSMVLSWTLDKLGPIARTVEDCALVLAAIYGPDGEDPFAIDAPFQWEPSADIRGLRVGYVKRAFESVRDATPGYDNTVAGLRKREIEVRESPANDNATLRVLENLGVTLVPIELPDLPLDALPVILNTEGGAAFEELTRSNRDDLLHWQDESSQANRFRQAHFIPSVAYIQASRARTLLIEAMAETMRDVDLFVVPQLGGNNLSMTNLTGQPCVGIPNGFDNNGMPTGIYFVGKPFGERDLLAVTHAVQQATGFHLRRPPLA